MQAVSAKRATAPLGLPLSPPGGPRRAGVVIMSHVWLQAMESDESMMLQNACETCSPERYYRMETLVCPTESC